MKVLFSPSEAKGFPTSAPSGALELRFGGVQRHKVLKEYEKIMREGSEAEILRLWGQKELNLEALARCQNLYTSPREKAIRLYEGVAYRALDFDSLTPSAQAWVEESVVIFSNLLGVVGANEAIPYYRLKQGCGFEGFETRGYLQRFSKDLERFLGGDEVMDLRAEYYQGSFVPKNLTHRPIFYRGGKKVSHYAKYYRGRLLRALAQGGGEFSEDILKSEGVLLKGIATRANLRLMEFEVAP